jgi:hypothetical protein
MENQALVSFEDAVKIKLKAMVADLIPEERWDGIVNQTITEFVAKDLPLLIKKELEAEFGKKIKEALAAPEFTGYHFDNGQRVATELVTDLIKEQAPTILASFVGGLIQMQVQDIQNRLRGY